MGSVDESINTFISVIKQEWANIPQRDIDNYILSIENRYTGVVEARG